MTIQSTVRKAGPYACNGVTVAFPFSFKVFAASDVLVTQTDLSSVETPLTLAAQYSVALNADQNALPGGTVTLVSAPATGYLVTVTSAIPESQLVSLQNLGGFNPTVINDALDKVTALHQQNSQILSRTLTVPVSSALTPAAYLANLTPTAALNAPLNAKNDFGAVGNGIADDTTKLQNAITAACTQARALYIPAGVYLCSSALTTGSAAQPVIFGDAGLTILKATNATMDLLVIGDGTTQIVYPSVRDIVFDKTVTKTAGAALRVRKGYWGDFRNIRIAGHFIGILHDTNCVQCNTTGFTIINSTPATGVGIRIVGAGNESSFVSGEIQCNAGFEGLYGIDVQSNLATWWSNIDVICYNTGVRISPQVTGDAVMFQFFNQVAADTCTGPGWLIDCAATDAAANTTGIHLSDCWAGTNQTGVLAQRTGTGTVKDLVFNNFHCWNNTQHGFNFSDAAATKEVQITNSQIAGNGTSAGNTYDGIRVAAGLQTISINYNTIGAWGGYSATQKYGVNLLAGATNHVSVQGNNLNNNATAGIINGASGADQLVTNNLGSDGWTSYTPTITCGSGAFTTVSATGLYKAVGKTVYFDVQVSITTNGTAGGWVNFTVPTAEGAGSRWAFAGRGFLSGKAVQANLTGGGTVVGVTNYDGTYPGANGEILVVSGFYQST